MRNTPNTHRGGPTERWTDACDHHGHRHRLHRSPHPARRAAARSTGSACFATAPTAPSRRTWSEPLASSSPATRSAAARVSPPCPAAFPGATAQTGQPSGGREGTPDESPTRHAAPGRDVPPRLPRPTHRDVAVGSDRRSEPPPPPPRGVPARPRVATGAGSRDPLRARIRRAIARLVAVTSDEPTEPRPARPPTATSRLLAAAPRRPDDRRLPPRHHQARSLHWSARSTGGTSGRRPTPSGAGSRPGLAGSAPGPARRSPCPCRRSGSGGCPRSPSSAAGDWRPRCSLPS